MRRIDLRALCEYDAKQSYMLTYICHVSSFHEEGDTPYGDFSMSVKDFKGSFVRPFLEYVKTSHGKPAACIFQHTILIVPIAIAPGGNSAATTASSTAAPIDSGTQQSLHENEAEDGVSYLGPPASSRVRNGSLPAAPTREIEREDTPAVTETPSSAAPITSSMTDTSSGDGSRTSSNQDHPVSPSGESAVRPSRSLPHASEVVLRPLPASSSPGAVGPSTLAPSTNTLGGLNVPGPSLDYNGGLGDDGIDYSILNGLQYNLWEFHPEPPPFPPSMLEDLLMFQQPSQTELFAHGLPEQPARDATSLSHTGISSERTGMQRGFEAPSRGEHATQPHTMAPTSASQDAPSSSRSQSDPPSASGPQALPETPPALQVMAPGSLQTQFAQASDPASGGSAALQSPAAMPGTGPPRLQHTTPASLSAALAGAYPQHNGMPVQQGSLTVDGGSADALPTVDHPDRNMVSQMPMVSADNQPVSTARDSEGSTAALAQDQQQAPSSTSPTEVDASAPNHMTGGRARRERRPRMNPDGTWVDSPGTGRYSGGGTVEKQGGEAPPPSSKKRAKGKQAGPRTTKKKR